MKENKLSHIGVVFSLDIVGTKVTPPMLSQHSRSQALVKEEGCDRCGEPTLNLAILIEMKPERKPLGRNPLSDAPYQNLGMVSNGQGPGQHPLGDASCHEHHVYVIMHAIAGVDKFLVA